MEKAGSPLRRLLDPALSRLRALDAQLARSARDRFEAHLEASTPPPPRVRAARLEATVSALRPERRPLVEHHWATWCDGCVEEMPLIVQLDRALADRADLVSVSWDRFDDAGSLEATLERVGAQVQKAGLTAPTLVVDAAPDAFFSALGLRFRQIPQTRVLDADGGLLRSYEGALTPADVDAIRALVGA
jgi:thiol-disulfide isomerase/thioredoxin